MSRLKQNIQDPSFIGTQGLKGLQGIDSTEDTSNYSYGVYTPSMSEAQHMSVLSRDMRDGIENVKTPEDFGKSFYDSRVTDLSELNNLQDFRANEQSGVLKIANGIGKGLILAGTTFADGVLGTIAGGLNIINNVDTIKNSDNKWREVGNAFINNSFSKLMHNINTASEEWMPNYYTKAEQEDPWYRHIFSANFLGDKFIKNLGFMIGAAYSGKVNAGAVSKMMGLSKVRNAFKGVVTTASGKVLTSSDDIARAYATGDAFMDGVKLTDDLGKAAKKLKNAELALKIVGSTSAAMGEGRIEAISNTESWEKMHRQLLDEDYARRKSDLERNLAITNPELFDIIQTPDGVQLIPNSQGSKVISDMHASLDAQYNASLEELAKRAATMSNQVFLSNVLVLSASNALQFGRFFSGGYTQGRNFLNLLKKNKAGELVGNKNAIVVSGIKTAISPLTEANEEMAQAFVSTASGLQQAAKLNSFYGYKIDQDATEEMVNWTNAASQALKDTYSNIDAWEEGFIGLLTGFLGMPSFSLQKNDKSKTRPKFKLDGEFWQGISDTKELSKQQKEMVNTINNAIKSERFKNYFEGLVRDRAINAEKDVALKSGKPFDYKNSELKELVNWAIVFDKAGRLQDLYDTVDEFSNVTVDDIETIKQNTIDKQTGKSIYDEMTDDDIISHFKQEGEQIKNTIEEYTKISHDLKTLYGEGISQDVLEEMSYTLTQISDWENRFKELHEKVKEGMKKESSFRWFGKNQGKDVYSINDILDTMNSDELMEEVSSDRFQKIINDNFASNQRVKTLNIQQLIQNLNDMVSIAKGRKDFISKYNTLSKHPELFAKGAEQLREQIVNQFKDKVKKTVLEGAKDITNAKDLKQYLESNVDSDSIEEILDSIEDSESTPELKKAAKDYKDISFANRKINEIIEGIPRNTETAPLFATLENILNKVSSVQELEDDLEEAINKFKSLGTQNGNDVAETLQTVLEEYKKAVKSHNSTKKSKKKKNKTSEEAKPEQKKEQKKSKGWEMPTGEEDDAEADKKEESIESLIQNLNDLSIAELEDLLEKEFENEESDAVEQFRKVVQQVIDSKNKEFATPDNTKDDIGNADDNAEATDTESYKQTLRSWYITKYNIKALKESNSLVKMPDTEGIIKFLDNLGVYDFIDRGYLGELLQRNKDLKIHYISGKFQDAITLLAVEVDDSFTELQQDGIIEALNPITADDGKQYQCIGVLSFNKKNENASKMYATIKSLLSEEMEDSDSEYFVSKKYNNKVRKIYSGRMILETEYGKADENWELTEQHLEDAVLGIWYNNTMHAPIDTEKETIVDLNGNNPNDKEGSVWLLTKEADGRYYAKSVKVKRFSKQEYNIDEFKDTPLMQELIEHVKILVDPSKSVTERAAAKYALSDILYLEDLNILFNDSTISIVKDDITDSDVLNAYKSSSVEDRTIALLELLQDYNLRFQIDVKQITDSSNSRYLQDIIDSKILITDLELNPYTDKKLANNVNASFDLHEVDSEGNILESDDTLTGHTGNKGKNKEKHRKVIHINGEEVYEDYEGNIIYDNEVLDDDSIHKQAYEAIRKLEEGTYNYIGNSNIYEFTSFDISGDIPVAIEKVAGGYKLYTNDEAIDKINKAKEKAVAKKRLAKLEEKGEMLEKGEDDLGGLYSEDDFAENQEEEPFESGEDDKGGLYNDDDQEDEYNDEDETENSEEKPKLTFEKAASLTASERSAKSMYIVSKEALGVLQKKGYTLKSFTELCKQHGESFDYITNAEELEAKIDVLENCR